jgi:dihydroorotate dehydrogenase (NAD+) catalytic subunit
MTATRRTASSLPPPAVHRDARLPAIRPLALFAVYTAYERIRIPIIGMGGIAAWQDAVEFLLAGATAVAVGTQNFVNPLAMRGVIQGLRAYLERAGLASVRELIGLAHRGDGKEGKKGGAV